MNVFKRVTSYNDGRVVFYYDDKEVIYRKNQEPEVINKEYNKKGIYEFLRNATTIHSSSNSFIRD